MGRRRIKRTSTKKKPRNQWRSTPPSVELAHQIKEQRRLTRLRELASVKSSEEAVDGDAEQP